MSTTQAKERPILFSGEMVRAILSGAKTQTRRIIKPQPDCFWNDGSRTDFNWPYRRDTDKCIPCPYGVAGDRLWVRESYRIGGEYAERRPASLSRLERQIAIRDNLHYLADRGEAEGPWRPSIHMPRWASRITLEITAVRVERLQDISQPDIAAEGIDCHPTSREKTKSYYRGQFRSLWNKINGPDSWAANPWVWCVEFRRIEP